MTEIIKDPMTRQECIAWIKALRSGKYEQGTGQMCSTGPDGEKMYCCLGVANVIWNLDIDGGRAVLSDEGATSLAADITYFKLPFDTQEKLYRMNDSDKCSFEQIADYIEQEILPTLES